MTPEYAERLGRLADELDSILYPLRLPGLPDRMHLEALSGKVRQARDEIAAIVREATGEDPWATNPLEG